MPLPKQQIILPASQRSLDVRQKQRPQFRIGDAEIKQVPIRDGLGAEEAERGLIFCRATWSLARHLLLLHGYFVLSAGWMEKCCCERRVI